MTEARWFNGEYNYKGLGVMLPCLVRKEGANWRFITFGTNGTAFSQVLTTGQCRYRGVKTTGPADQAQVEKTLSIKRIFVKQDIG
jgi:hypothetical protein